MSGLDQRVATVETQVASWTDRDQELLYLRSKLIDLEDRSRRNNVRLLGFPEGIEGADLFSYLRETLPKLTEITFDPPCGISKGTQAGPQAGPQETGTPPSYHSLLAATHVGSQTATGSQNARPIQIGHLEIRISADFSKETAERRKAFLSLRSRLCQLNVKFGPFEPARMWITKNGESQNFYDPEICKCFWMGYMTSPTPWK
ncbi:hypothetical protein NDU88_005251 [Pleurodeles waltl]|uniref:Uncharacterized protein n=1 Tax=Pleurodeles waltl TaxID=8319 RepID=A0AAV7SL46_PLEWA|nr:hypothetical protein NDU88_005251 [Pleurodeles waltl]